MATPEQITNLRGASGIDRSETSRINNQGSWYTTQNLWGRSPGMLAKRPGSALLVDGRNVVFLDPAAHTGDPNAPGGGGNGTYPIGGVIVPTATDITTNIYVDSATQTAAMRGSSVVLGAALQTITASFSEKLQGTTGMIARVNS